MSIPGLGWANLPKSFFQNGVRSYKIAFELHAESRQKLVTEMASRGITSGVVLLQGGEEQNQYDTDTELVFRQDSWFNFLWGVREPGFYGAIELSSGKTTLFCPELPDSYRIWCGEIKSCEYFRTNYSVDNVLYTQSLPQWLTETLTSRGGKVYLLEGENSDSGLRAKPAHFDGIEALAEQIDLVVLHHALSTARVIKSTVEIEAMRYAALVASNAHVEVMRHAKPGMMEFELEAKFQYEIYAKGGCRKTAYTSICACGPNNAVLHYGHAAAPNDQQTKDSDMALLDMGAEYHGYVSDITCTFPLTGTFAPAQRIIYEGVLAAQRAVMEAAKPGVSWVDMHIAASREVLKAMLTLRVLSGSLDDLLTLDVGAVFMPHGLGHLIGCDTHDVGGYIDGTPERSSRPGVSKLRTARTLLAGMVLTNEPGCYFIDALLDAALKDPKMSAYFVPEKVNEFRGYGGVRLEDVILITEDGSTNLTTCPRTVEEVEAVMAGAQWPPALDTAPYLRREWQVLSEDLASFVTDKRVSINA